MSTCRYQHGVPCDGPGSLGFSLCPSCKGPVDVSRDKKTATAAPETEREEVKKMPKPTPSPTGTCPECKRDGQQLRTSKHVAPGKRYCDRCIAKFASRVKSAAAKHAAAPSAPAKTAASPKPRPEPIAPQRPVQSLGGALSLTFRVTLEPGLTAEAAVEILRQLPTGAVLV